MTAIKVPSLTVRLERHSDRSIIATIIDPDGPDHKRSTHALFRKRILSFDEARAVVHRLLDSKCELVKFLVEG